MKNDSIPTSLILGTGLAVGLVVFAMTYMSYKNAMVESENNVEQKMGDLQSTYQRRADLIPNLVSTVEAAANQESSMQTNIARLRSAQAAAAQVPAGSSAEDLARYAAVQQQLTSAIRIVVEAYPQMQSIAGFRDLQSQIEGTENRINVARRDYNEAVTEYNNTIGTFPGSLFAGGRTRKHPFQASSSAQAAPSVNFHQPVTAQ